MQFVKNGPDIPERLLQAHEDGRVVFFCGAGVSYPARLPGFNGLVDQLYDAVATTPDAVQKAAIKAGQFDTAIGLLEANIIGGRETVRRALAGILTPDLGARNATATHEALLTLGKNREGRTRLVTTNFDRLFEEVIEEKNLTLKCYQAPLLPVPKSRWDGLVYLHGLLSRAPTSNELDSLVVSSGDFGLSYLTERWAARFVSEMFRNYTVCFVGYSINDPVLRYMMDALAADRLLGEFPPEMFAFGSFSKGKDEVRANEWRAKNVTPILYREHNRHAYLHKTLRAWAGTYRDGVRGKERIVVECAMGRPLASTRQDNFVGRLLWALSDPSGLPAKRFAELDPVPSLDWLKPLSEDRYQHADLERFGVPPRAKEDDKLAYSLMRRPSPYHLAPWMSVRDIDMRGGGWDEVMQQLARWLMRHLGDPTFLWWLVKNRSQLHADFAWLIEYRLDALNKLEQDGDTVELENIRANAKKAIPSPNMRTLWRIVLAGRVKSRPSCADLYRWLERCKREGLSTSLRQELRCTLSPKVMLREPAGSVLEELERGGSERIKDLIDWDIVLSADHAYFKLREMREDPFWMTLLPQLLTDFCCLLLDVLDLERELGSAQELSDLSFLYRPSIAEHEQNNDFLDWTILIDLTRDAWLATVSESPERAALVAESWRQTPYPLFRRLAFFAAAQGGVIPPRLSLDWLLDNRGWWLWSVETRRESMRLLAAIAISLDETMREELEQAVLAGPPRDMFEEDVEPDRWDLLVDRETWLRLAKIIEAGADLGADAQERLNMLSERYPEWRIAPDQRDEFASWAGDEHEWRKFTTTPRGRRELVEWLRQHPGKDIWQEDDWRERCRINFATAACSLFHLAREGVWPTERWRDALQVWSEEKFISRSWRYIAPTLSIAPDDALKELAHTVSSWLESASKIFKRRELLFFNLVGRILELDNKGAVDSDEPVFYAVNHPVGHITQALLQWWYRQGLEDGERLPEIIKLTFTELCDISIEQFRHGRVMLAANIIALFRVDPEWTKQCLLPLFDWKLSEMEARAAWGGFLWSPRLYRPLIDALKSAFLDTANHYAKLGEHSRQYASMLTFSALDLGGTFTNRELAAATRSLPPEGLHQSAQALVRALEGSGAQRAEYWANRIVPYLHAIWPKSRDNISPAIAESLGRLCIAAHDAFPEALQLLRVWLQPLPYPGYLINQLGALDLCTRFPEQTLDFLNLIIDDQTQLPFNDLSMCLDSIRRASSELQSDIRFRNLTALVRIYDR